MAENKKSFLLYADLINTVEKIPDAKAGKLFKLILEYVNDRNPQTDDLLLQIAFEPIKQQLKRDLVTWLEYRAKQSENGKLGGRGHKKPQSQKKPKKGSLYLESQKSLNVNVTVNDNDNVIVNDDEKEKSPPPSKKEIYGSTILFELDELKARLESDQYWIEISAKNLGAEISQIEKAIPEFIIHLGAIEEVQKSIKDAKRHFNSWYPKRKNNQNLKNDNGNTNSDKVGKLTHQQLADFTKPRAYT